MHVADFRPRPPVCRPGSHRRRDGARGRHRHDYPHDYHRYYESRAERRAQLKFPRNGPPSTRRAG